MQRQEVTRCQGRPLGGCGQQNQGGGWPLARRGVSGRTSSKPISYRMLYRYTTDSVLRELIQEEKEAGFAFMTRPERTTASVSEQP